MNKYHLAVVLFFALALVSAGCSSGTNNSVAQGTVAALASAPTAVPSSAPPSPTLILDPAPDFSVARFDTGETITLSKLKGKPVILNFFASWCPSCRAEVPGLEKFWKKYTDCGLVLLAVALDDAKEIAAKYRVKSIPTFVLVDRAGQIFKYVPGMLSEDALAAQAETLLK